MHPQMQPTSPYAAFIATATRWPGRPMLVAPASAGMAHAPEGLRIPYAQAANAVDALIAGFKVAGLGAGHRVALVLENRPEMIFHWLALNALGASMVPINPDLKPAELRYQLEKSRSNLVIGWPAHDALVAAGCPDDLPRMHPGEPVPQLPPAPGQPEGLTAESALLFTSGSTGLPKACILSNEYFLRVAQWYVSSHGFGPMTPGAEVALTPLPLFHMNALGCTVLGMILCGGAMVCLDRFHARRWWATVADSGASIVHALGVIPAILLKLDPVPQETAHRARVVFSPGVDPAHKLAFQARYGVPIAEGWAMTETGGAGVIATAGVPMPDGRPCIGVPCPGMEWRLVDDAWQDVGLGAPGELLCRSAGPDPRAGFFSGYLGDEDATAEAWQGGWFHTGDIMTCDDRGRFYFVDRKKSIVRRSGENISSLEVEAALALDPSVQVAGVAPVPDELRGEEVLAFVVPGDPAAARDAAAALALLERCAARLSYHKLPGWVVFADALPLTATNKLMRGQLKSEGAAAVAAGRALDVRAQKALLRTNGAGA